MSGNGTLDPAPSLGWTYLAFLNILIVWIRAGDLWIQTKQQTRFERLRSGVSIGHGEEHSFTEANVRIHTTEKRNNCSSLGVVLIGYEWSRGRLVLRLRGTSSSSHSSGGVGIRPLYVPLRESELLGPGRVARARAVSDEASGNWNGWPGAGNEDDACK